MICNYVTFWWRKESGYTVPDDIRFVVGKYRCGGPWTVQRKNYAIVVRYGLAFRRSVKSDWRFIGYMRFADLPNTDEKLESVSL